MYHKELNENHWIAWHSRAFNSSSERVAYIFLTLKSGYLGKVFSRSQHIQQGLKTLKKALMKKSPQNMDMMVKRRSIMVNLTSSCPNIVSQHNFLSLIFSLRSFWYWLVTTEQSSREELGDGQVWSLHILVSFFVDQGGLILFSQVHSFRRVSWRRPGTFAHTAPTRPDGVLQGSVLLRIYL